MRGVIEGVMVGMVADAVKMAIRDKRADQVVGYQAGSESVQFTKFVVHGVLLCNSASDVISITKLHFC
jgi:hypothetical protein